MGMSSNQEPLIRLASPFRDPIRKTIFSVVSAPLERLLAIDRVNQIYFEVGKRTDDRHFADKVLEVMNVSYTIATDDLERIPKEGPLVVVANHPFGGIEGILMCALLRQVRTDVKFMANFLLGRMPDFRDSLILVDPFGGGDAAKANIKPLKESLKWLKDGHVLGVFPSGEVSHINLLRGGVTDPQWSDTIGRIVRATRSPVVPMFFKGSNGFLFNLLGLVHPRLRTAMLPSELANKQDKLIDIRIGNAIAFKKLERFERDSDMMDYLRMRTYYLENRKPEAKKHMQVTPFPVRLVKPKEVPIAPPVDPELLRAEVNRLPLEQVLVDSGTYLVLYAGADQIPQTLREIGRLREVTFRDAGEGTGQAIDIDRFDDYYIHLFVWNKATNEVVGAYRLGQTDLIMDRLGIRGLYTSTLFRYKASLLRHISPALEMGRSFVRKEYQRSFAALQLLWRGIGAYVVKYPRYKILFGPVSVNNDYQSSTRQLLAMFLKMNNFQPDLAKLVKARKPMRENLVEKWKARKARLIVDDLAEVESLISDVETDLKTIPILLKQYLKLGGKLLGFNVDPAFSDVLDGLILVDLTKSDRKVIDRYMTKEGVDRLLAYHGLKPGPAAKDD